MTTKFAALAAAAVVALGGASAHAATPMPQEVVRVPPAKMAVARRSVDVQTSAIQRATALMAVLNDPSLQSASTAEDYLAAVQAMTPRINAARAELKIIAGQLEALPDAAAEGDPAQLQLIDVMAADLLTSVGRMDALLESVTDLGAAVEVGDAEAAQSALKRMSEGMMVMIDGQAAMFRARVVLADPESSLYAQGMTLACLYESFAAISRGELEYLPVAEAAAKSEAALDCARTQIAGGRAAMAREESQRSSAPSTRAIQVRMAEIGVRLLDEMERAHAGLASATTVLKSGGEFDAIELELDKFQAAELAISRLGAEQMAAATAR